ncbi:hypothetical protein Q31b_41730 [Novipirellula aureliae]|uniref:Ice-binding protein C-terminal domain-containing protein n=1 Tax=Novipirellula aureliae TaxID=2527966 RepID=A0A5C6DUJ2_9BACT|nr:PEP-CTERM sorting domain-containing protein [Novipirellula aureliae]TWU39091.1 hypothetical protein Q31b_41730 [Novipirellula aureliae]
MKFWKCVVPLVAMIVAGSSASADVFTYLGDTGGASNLNVVANWSTGGSPATGLPVSGDTANVNVDATWPNTSAALGLIVGGDLIFDGGITVTAATDVVGTTPDSVTFNNVTVNVGDDIFTGGAGGNFIFNDGSVTNVDDDFQANGGGTITINGGTHLNGIAPQGTAQFGAQNASTMNVNGGTITTGIFGVGDTGLMTIGGSAVLSGGGDTTTLAGTIDVSDAWTGSWTIDGLVGTAWRSEVIGGGWLLDGNIVDETIFDSGFLVTNSGQTLSLAPSAVPEPGSLAVLGLCGVGMIVRRRRQK